MQSEVPLSVISVWNKLIQCDDMIYWLWNEIVIERGLKLIIVKLSQYTMAARRQVNDSAFVLGQGVFEELVNTDLAVGISIHILHCLVGDLTQLWMSWASASLASSTISDERLHHVVHLLNID